jgi:UDPglucose 6-dehydrogenase
MVAGNTAAGRLLFTTNYDIAVAHGEVIFLAVGTPPDEDGGADLSHVLAAARSVGKRLRHAAIVVNKSTVPVGTADKVAHAIEEALRERGMALPFSVVSNPEFLKEGAAVADFMRPDRIVIGSDDPRAIRKMRQVYAPFNRNHDKVLEMDVRSAELTKYAANAMLAARISFMNELAGIADAVGADIETVRHGLGSDPRIGPHFLYAGVGYGGSCFPKDLKALTRTARDHGCLPRMLGAIDEVNELQKTVLFDKICRHFGGASQLAGKTVALWGLAFKPNTDDMREAPSMVLIRQLLEAGCKVAAYDPVARDEARRKLQAEHGEATVARMVQLVDNAWAATDHADALAVVTEWQEFRARDFRRLAETLRAKAVFDGRNLYDPEQVREAGLHYYGIGRAGAAA